MQKIREDATETVYENFAIRAVVSPIPSLTPNAQELPNAQQ
jgi:hypothetical protein